MELQAQNRNNPLLADRCVTFSSDFGHRDAYVASVKGIILGISPKVKIIDISHEISQHDVCQAAFLLASCYHCFPSHSIHLVVVDPGVGSNRSAIIASSSDHVFVAPDNGVLSLVLKKEKIKEVIDIKNNLYFRQPVAPTFHGRDILGPVAAHLANGVPAQEFGPVLKEFVKLDVDSPNQKRPNTVLAKVMHVDRFGNIITNVQGEDLIRWFGKDHPRRIEIQGQIIDHHYSYYAQAPPKKLFSILGSSGFLEISVFSNSAARILGTRVGAMLKLTN